MAPDGAVVREKSGAPVQQEHRFFWHPVRLRFPDQNVGCLDKGGDGIADL